jgi:hypothetical protein
MGKISVKDAFALRRRSSASAFSTIRLFNSSRTSLTSLCGILLMTSGGRDASRIPVRDSAEEMGALKPSCSVEEWDMGPGEVAEVDPVLVV